MTKVQPTVGIYVGQGASHSWTWLADIFDREDYTSVCFLDDEDVAAGTLGGVAVFFVSGGDTFAIAQALGAAGAAAIKAFVEGGGIYIGACAGAYLPLNSSLPPLNQFNFVAARIANLTKELPEAIAQPEKFCTEYGCRYVYHPVRESMRLRLTGWGNGGYVNAPLYGGPALLPSDEVTVLAEYDAFTDATEFLIERDIAERALLGTAAAIRKEYGKGVFYLFGPHFEHPDFAGANQLLLEIFLEAAGGSNQPATRSAGEAATREAYRQFLSAVSSARIMALALERRSWLIGRKVYDPEKIRVFLEAIWSRCRRLDYADVLTQVNAAEVAGLTGLALEIGVLIQSLRNEEQPLAQETEQAERLFLLLRKAAATFLTIYFRLKHGGELHQQRRSSCTTVTCISPQPQRSMRCRC